LSSIGKSMVILPRRGVPTNRTASIIKILHRSVYLIFYHVSQLLNIIIPIVFQLFFKNIFVSLKKGKRQKSGLWNFNH
jgi:hypothetical protein